MQWALWQAFAFSLVVSAASSYYVKVRSNGKTDI